ncbi:transcriptional regulator HexR [Modicisalibacter tunisiensis]|uniref:Transcriptional regulator HexR n=1 Tax=Modicisalibacter tunisiensis TaxID=390637 RepID=A0ABS7WWE3_9GAMM|nr:transcriptional regulator HexR [Modicisalibacter tunisiensis]KXS38210.1 MAG: RpiR family transcriptional regulator [Halomonadaceae bacterium T82-2]MBZ9539686.1 transcriptional regulator HexR [Modicisalibacter tunisiensis]MBZ9566926.1 transcriptional regulator HexR [Modicisalibacter tunisiensis]
MSRALFDEMRRRMEHFRRSEQKVARFVLRHPDEVIHMRIVDLATEAKVSEPTVVRFCRALGCSGFQDFKLQLAQMLAAGSQFAQFSMNDSDSVAEFSHSLFDSTIGTLLSVRDRLDNDALGRAVNALAMANRVEFYGFGASGAVAFDAQHKFFRLQISTSAYTDPHMQNMSAATLQEGDVVVAISQTGRTRALVDSVRLAREKGATVIGLCPSRSPLADEVSLPLYIDVHEDTEIYTPMSSRIAHLVIIDVLAVGVAKTRGPKLAEQLKAVKRSLTPLRFPEPGEGTGSESPATS